MIDFETAPLKCPQCGHAVLIMAASCEVIVAADGSAVIQSPEWPDYAPAKCHAGCGWQGRASEARCS
jgi:hypothetical protein